jgi:ribosomal protein S6--L-glutamate ligase
MRILILSRRSSLYSTFRLRQACRQLGHTSLVIDPLSCVLVLEDGRPMVYCGTKQLDDFDVIIPRIGMSGMDYGTAVVRQFEAMGVPTVCSQLAISQSKDKLACLQKLVTCGLPVPTTVVTRAAGDVEAALRRLGGAPAILKLMRGSHGTGVILSESKESVSSVLDAVWCLGADAMIQEFIAESRGVDIRAFIIGNEVVAAMRRHASKGDFRSNIHRGGYGEKISLSRTYRSMALKAARCVELQIAGVDILESKDGPLIVEVNSSPGFQGIEEATGVDVASRIIKFAISCAKKRPRGRKRK